MYPLLIVGGLFVGGYLLLTAGSNSSSGDRAFDYTDKKGRVWHFKGGDAQGWDVTSSGAPPYHVPPGTPLSSVYGVLDSIPLATGTTDTEQP